MKVNREKLQLAMARSCLDTKGLTEAAQLPRPTVNNVICGKGVGPKTLGRIARALDCDPAEIIEEA